MMISYKPINGIYGGKLVNNYFLLKAFLFKSKYSLFTIRLTKQEN
jgi:hypothetical protein